MKPGREAGLFLRIDYICAEKVSKTLLKIVLWKKFLACEQSTGYNMYKISITTKKYLLWKNEM